MSLSKGKGRSSTAGSQSSSTKFAPGNVKKKAAVLHISSSSEDENSENDSVQDSGQGGMNYRGEDSSEGEPPEKRRRQSKTLKKGTGTRHASKDGGGKEEEEEEYYVEKIVDMNYCSILKKKFFCVKWLNYPSADNTWEPEEHLTNSRGFVDEFLEKINKATKKSDDAKELAATKMQVASSKKAVQAKNIKNRTVLKNKNRNGIESSHSKEDARVMKMMEASAEKVVNLPSSTMTSAQVDTKERVMDWLEEINLGISRTVTTQPGNIFYFKVLENDDQVGWIVIDTKERLPEKEEYYKCIVTEDLTGKQPKLVYGATTSVDGEKFCLVQFEGQSYVDVIPPDYLFARFPSYRQFFEVHCPNLFAKLS